MCAEELPECRLIAETQFITNLRDVLVFVLQALAGMQHQFVGKRKIRYSDLDGNGHVYNAVYGDIVSDFLPEELINRQIVGFQINYQTEAVLGEELDLFLASDPTDENGWYLEGRNAAGGNCFISRIEFWQA